METTLLKFFIPELTKISRVGGMVENPVREKQPNSVGQKPIFIHQ